ncbi:MAG: hypothetical protein HC886_17560 [Leptolyngbyaceae cyanobacterium SM1_1_3]|nr:hypothetical protein [Leptolyngbyaceae cyanobacterium SM1_1_3]NJN03790.1 hypothetical protein [Leptolyngbyaceae cyanobacterium RM1_1_2]NJO11112.1 hypothetical protein [Leptolyngbyaceae cyanobacterium SL_1_1]
MQKNALALRAATQSESIQLSEAKEPSEPDEEDLEESMEQRFQNLTPLSETTAISDFITWGEYALFMADQNSKAFPSWAKPYLPEPDHLDALVNQNISWEDARWFCAWLSTQSNRKRWVRKLRDEAI